MKAQKNTQDPRTLAIKTLVAIQNGTSLAQILHKNLDELAPNERSFYHELVLGTMRQWFAFVRISDNLAHHPIKDPAALAAVHLGMYQLFYMRTPDHAAIGETVTALKKAGSETTAGLVNALLRKCQKDFSKIAKKIDKNHSLPNWLAKQLKTDWKPYYNELSTNLREATAIFLRVNPRRISTFEYAQFLGKEGIAYTLLDETIRLDSRVSVENLPHFDEGYISVQDVNAQKAVACFSDLTNKTVLDICAAPGGKTAQILENYDVQALCAIDVDPERTMRIADNLSRLNLLADNISLQTADASTINIQTIIKDNAALTSSDENGFDAILLDAPCTATGVIRRHPDICLLRMMEDVAETAQLQYAILQNAWTLLKKGGELVYVTCSILKEENAEQIARFLQETPDAQAVPVSLNGGIEQEFGQQFLPVCVTESTFIGDGFYIAKLKKV